MIAINHALTGALIGFSVSNPVLAIFLALISHFVLDSIPHFSVDGDNDAWIKSKPFISMVAIDAVLCFILVMLLLYNHPLNYILAAVCAFVAAAPDLVSFNKFYANLKNKKWKPSLYTKFASKIQWFEKPIGGAVEVTWFIIMLVSVSLFI
ncbi:MAG TPA: hypothetical protein VIH90_07120 [Candidatus Saccharimonadales bacterium]